MSDAIKRFTSELPFPFSKALEAGGFLFLSVQVSMSAEQAFDLDVEIEVQALAPSLVKSA